MAARLHKRHQADIRQKIQAAVLIDLLQKNARGDLEPEMSQGRIRSAQILLDKSVSNAPLEVTGAAGDPIVVEMIKRVIVDSK